MSEQTTSETLRESGEDDIKTAQELHTEAHDPAVPEAYAAFMRTGWGDRELDLPRQPVADLAAARRDKLAGMFPGERLVLPAGTFKVRSNDTDYKFRPDTAHTYFSGNQTSDAVLVVEDGESVLYARPRSARDTDEFFRDRQYGELWVGRRPSLHELSDSGSSAATSTRSRTGSPPPTAPRRPACCAGSRPTWTGWSPPTTRWTTTSSAWSASSG